ncbi:MAG: hypothetical protein ACRC5C_08985 [Bacilli bacterium]
MDWLSNLFTGETKREMYFETLIATVDCEKEGHVFFDAAPAVKLREASIQLNRMLPKQLGDFYAWSNGAKLSHGDVEIFSIPEEPYALGAKLYLRNSSTFELLSRTDFFVFAERKNVSQFAFTSNDWIVELVNGSVHERWFSFQTWFADMIKREDVTRTVKAPTVFGLINTESILFPTSPFEWVGKRMEFVTNETFFRDNNRFEPLMRLFSEELNIKWSKHQLVPIAYFDDEETIFFIHYGKKHHPVYVASSIGESWDVECISPTVARFVQSLNYLHSLREKHATDMFSESVTNDMMHFLYRLNRSEGEFFWAFYLEERAYDF